MEFTMTDLHLISWNRPKMTELVIKTIHRNTTDFALHVFDNGSKKQMQNMLKELEKQGLIHELELSDVNIGLEAARQQLLLHHTYSDLFVCIDNDCLPPVGWLPEQILLMDRYSEFGAIAQRTQVMIGTGNIFDGIEDDVLEFPHPGGSFRIMRTEAVREVGGWSEPESGRGAEERYICGKLNKHGYKTGFATNIQCLHLFGMRNQTDERWGYESGMKPEDTGHSDIHHPALINGDDPKEIEKYAGKELTDDYCVY